MKRDKKLLSMAMFILMMTSCSSLYHFNVIKNIADNNLLVEDVETHQERIVILNTAKGNKTFLSFFEPGDTVIIRTPFYDDFVLEPDIRTRVYFNGDSIYSRAREHYFQTKKQELFPDKVR
jgi:mRNA degradation ribonuclease J1/J2